MFMGQPYLPDQTKPPRNVYNTPLCRGNKNQVHIYLYPLGYRGTLLSYAIFLWSHGRQAAVDSTQTQLVSPCRAVIFSAALLMKQTDPHSARCITRALIAVHYSVSCLTFIQSSVVTWGPFRRRNEAICLYAECSKRRSRVQDNRFLFFFHPHDKARCFLTQNTKQADQTVSNVSNSWLKN